MDGIIREMKSDVGSVGVRMFVDAKWKLKDNYVCIVSLTENKWICRIIKWVW